MLNLSALVAAILIGLFTLFIGFIAIQPAIQIVLVKLAPITNEPFLAFVSQVLSYVVLPGVAARITYLESLPSKRYRNYV